MGRILPGLEGNVRSLPVFLAHLANSFEVVVDKASGFPNVVVSAGFRILIDNPALVRIHRLLGCAFLEREAKLKSEMLALINNRALAADWSWCELAELSEQQIFTIVRGHLGREVLSGNVDRLDVLVTKLQDQLGFYFVDRKLVTRVILQRADADADGRLFPGSGGNRAE